MAFDYIENDAILRGYINLVIYNNWKIEDCLRQHGLLHESPEIDKIFVVNVDNLHWIILTNIDPTNKQSFDNYYDWGNSYQQNWYVYDSMNDPNNFQATSRILKLFNPEKAWEKVNLVNVEKQVGSSDCGLICIAYVQMLAISKDPYKLKFDQQKMRNIYNNFINYNYLTEFESIEIVNKEKCLNSILVTW